ncbi:MAG: APC family permease [Pseudomonadota bacterium]
MATSNGRPDVSNQTTSDLSRSFSVGGYISVGLGSIVGIGWVIYAAQWVLSGGPLGTAIAFAICTAFFLPIGACYAELSAAMPRAGGAMVFAYCAFGPMVSFLTGWAMALLYVSIAPFETIAIGALTEVLLPEKYIVPLYHIAGFEISSVSLISGVCAGIGLTIINMGGTRLSVNFQAAAVLLMLACVIVFTVTALVYGDVRNLLPLFSSNGALLAVAPASIIGVLASTPFFMAGWDTIPQAAEEAGIDMKPKRLATAIFLSIVLGGLFYIIIGIALGMSAERDTIANLIENKSDLPTAEIFQSAMGLTWAKILVLFTALLGLLTTLNAFMVAAPRLLFSLGRSGFLPEWFAHTHETRRTPVNSTLFVGLFAVLGPFLGSAALAVIVNSGSLCVALTYLIATAAALRLRTSDPDMNRPYQAPRGMITIGVIFAIVFISLMTVPGSPGQLRPIEYGIVLTWFLVGIVMYRIIESSSATDSEYQRRMVLGETG